MAVGDAKFGQRAAGRAQTDHLVKRVIGLAGDREHGVAGAQDAKEHGGQRMGSAEHKVAHKRVLRAEGRGIDPVDHRAAPVVVAISRGTHKVRVADGAGAKGIVHFLRVDARNAFNLSKAGRNARLHTGSQAHERRRKIKLIKIVHVSPSTIAGFVHPFNLPRPAGQIGHRQIDRRAQSPDFDKNVRPALQNR